MVFDTLYGVDLTGKTQPQMLAGHTVGEDGRLWTMTLRDGLRFHDGSPVLARDVIASLRRWASRDAFGTSLFANVDEITAPDDRTVRWRLKQPFPLLPEALGKVGAIVAFIMPERLASGDSAVAGKGTGWQRPFPLPRGSNTFPVRCSPTRSSPAYVPQPDRLRRACSPGRSCCAFRPGGVAGRPRRRRLRGQRSSVGEVDWWDQPIFDLLPHPAKADPQDQSRDAWTRTATSRVLRFNHTLPPFNNPAIRRAVLGAVKQRDYMTRGGHRRSIPCGGT